MARLNQDGGVLWAAQVNTPSPDSTRGTDVVLDGVGNVYATIYSGAVVKCSPDGTRTWLAQLNATFEGLALDGANNVIATGNFRGTVYFDPGLGVVNLSTGGPKNNPNYSAHVLKLTNNGAFVWARQFQATSKQPSDWTDMANGKNVEVDAAGNVYMTGSFQGSVDFDPGVGTFALAATGNNGSRTLYVVKLTAAGNLALASNTYGQMDALAVDGAGGVYLTGRFAGTGDFDPGVATWSLTERGNWDAFVTKYTTSGAFQWAYGLGGAGQSGYTDYGRGLAVDGLTGDIHLTGIFSGLIPADPYGQNGPTGSGGGVLTGTNLSFFVGRFQQGSALTAAGRVVTPAAGASSLTVAQAQALLPFAQGRWQLTGASIASLRGGSVLVTDLPCDQLGLAVGRTIYLDRDAAGHGWFVDRTPGHDREFVGGRAGSAARGRMDVLSVLTHELGHVLGHAHDLDGIMAERLRLGERTTPASPRPLAIRDALFASWSNGQRRGARMAYPG